MNTILITITGSLQNAEARAVIASLLMGLALLVICYGFMREQQYQEIQKRLRKLVSNHHPEEAEAELGSFKDRILRPLGHGILARLGRLTPGSNLESLRHQLALAGNPNNLAVIDILGMKMLAGLGASVLAGLYLFKMTNLPLVSALLFSLVGGGIGMYLPNYWLKQKITKRRGEMTKALPNALDMLTTMVDAGLGFDMALLRLSERWHNPLTDEFGRMVNEMNMGMRKLDALRNLADRNDVPELRSFVAVLIQADSLGISIVDILHTQSAQMRVRRRQWAEEQANKMPIKMLPVITLFIFPALFAVVLGPAVPGIVEAFADL